MTNTDQGRTPAVQPVDPAMQPVDPTLFAPLTTGENEVLGAHLTSGWYKQAAVYPTLSEPWKETGVLLNDLHAAYEAAIEDQFKMTMPPDQADKAIKAFKTVLDGITSEVSGNDVKIRMKVDNKVWEGITFPGAGMPVPGGGMPNPPGGVSRPAIRRMFVTKGCPPPVPTRNRPGPRGRLTDESPSAPASKRGPAAGP